MTTDSARQLPANPNITQLKRQAKELKRAVSAGDASALDRVRLSHPSYSAEAAVVPDDFTLRDAQVTIAREYGFDGWHQLSTRVGELMVEERDLHRWFGVQLNNDTWQTIEDESLDAHIAELDKERILYAAYASAYHWRTVGNEANFARAEHLISRVAARLGEGALALRHALRCLELVEANPDVVEDWDRAFAHEALARGLAAVGDIPAARVHFEEAVQITRSVSGAQDREILEKELARGPWFGLIET
jgi:hypothetical protein